MDPERLRPYLRSYFEARANLKKMAQRASGQELEGLEQAIPLGVGSRAGRSNINEWILSTVQFTKNQRESSKKSFNNSLLFVFRLLTIEYRVKYPMQGKSYHLDADVSNELLHSIVKGIDLVLQLQ